MSFAFSLPGGPEWIILFFSLFLLAMPVTIIVLFLKNRQLKKEITRLQQRSGT